MKTVRLTVKQALQAAVAMEMNMEGMEMPAVEREHQRIIDSIDRQIRKINEKRQRVEA